MYIYMDLSLFLSQTSSMCVSLLFMGDKQGVLVLLPIKANHASFANYNDTLPYVQIKTG